MNKTKLTGLTQLIIVLSLIPIFLGSCSKNNRLKYYSEKSNYIELQGTIANISFDNERESLVIALSDMSASLDDNHFKIVGKSYRTVLDNGISDHLEVGSVINITTAPRYFGDGYIFPVVSICIDGVEYLSFDDGQENLISWLKKR